MLWTVAIRAAMAQAIIGLHLPAADGGAVRVKGTEVEATFVLPENGVDLAVHWDITIATGRARPGASLLFAEPCAYGAECVTHLLAPLQYETAGQWHDAEPVADSPALRKTFGSRGPVMAWRVPAPRDATVHVRARDGVERGLHRGESWSRQPLAAGIGLRQVHKAPVTLTWIMPLYVPFIGLAEGGSVFEAPESQRIERHQGARQRLVRRHYDAGEVPLVASAAWTVHMDVDALGFALRGAVASCPLHPYWTVKRAASNAALPAKQRHLCALAPNAMYGHDFEDAELNEIFYGEGGGYHLALGFQEGDQHAMQYMTERYSTPAEVWSGAPRVGTPNSPDSFQEGDQVLAVCGDAVEAKVVGTSFSSCDFWFAGLEGTLGTAAPHPTVGTIEPGKPFSDERLILDVRPAEEPSPPTLVSRVPRFGSDRPVLWLHDVEALSVTWAGMVPGLGTVHVVEVEGVVSYALNVWNDAILEELAAAPPTIRSYVFVNGEIVTSTP